MMATLMLIFQIENGFNIVNYFGSILLNIIMLKHECKEGCDKKWHIPSESIWATYAISLGGIPPSRAVAADS